MIFCDVASLAPIHPSAAIREAYQRALDTLIDQMMRDTTRTLLAAYKVNPPVAYALYGMDASPARTMQGATSKLDRKWQRKFNERAPDIASRFAKAVLARTDRTFKAQLKKGGLGVKFKMTPAMNDAFQAVKLENINLISSIPAECMTQVESLVMESVSNGRDLAVLAKGLQDRVGITKRRAARIALDQNNKSTAVMLRTRQLGMGITEATWLHSAGGKVPRPKHVAFSGHKFDLAKGHDFDDGEGAVLPGQPINCRCVWKPVIPGFDDD